MRLRIHLRPGQLLALTLLLILSPSLATAQQSTLPEDKEKEKDKEKVPWIDELDGKVDLSRRLIEAHGFIPMPIIITEPALGGFGGGMGLIFLQKVPMDPSSSGRRLPPDLTGVAGGYTENKSWFTGGGRMATLPDKRLRYKVGGGYGDINLDFYDALERASGFNIKATPVLMFLGKMLRDTRFLFGGQYVWASTNVKLSDPSATLPPFARNQAPDSNIAALGVVAEFDGRDTIFSPDRGWLVHADYNWSEDWLGSDYDYDRLDSYVHWFTPVGRNWSNDRNWVSGLRLEWQQAYGDPPFFLLPYINMRGLPLVRYQGRTTALVETEQRIDFSLRYSAVVFGGAGKAFERASEASEADTIYTYGAGFRYLIAREFKVRVGIDVAKGPEDWAYYLIFGSAWFR